MENIYLYILALCILINGVCCKTIRDQLKNDLFRDYDSDIRPYCNSNEAVNVTLDMALRQLIEMYEPMQIIKANIWIRMKWTDCRLTWNTSEYAGITNLLVPYARLWVPDLTLYDNTGETFFGKHEFTPNVFSDGTVSYNFPSVIDNRCIIDIAKFPYDSQVCKFVFGSWAYHGEEINFIQKNSNGDLSTMEENVEWHITSMPAERHVLYYNCCPQPYPDVTFYVYMTRKPGFYIINILIPYFLITGVAVFGFILPCESGEKVSLEITVMLSLAVFQTLVADSLPPSSDNVPFLAIYFDFSMSLVGFATIIAVIVNNLYYREKQKIPKIIRVIFLDYGCKITFVQNPTHRDKTNTKDAEKKIAANNSNDKPKDNNNISINKDAKQVSKLKLSCSRLCSIVCRDKKPDNFTQSTETLTNTAAKSMSKVGSEIEPKQTEAPFRTTNGFLGNLPSKQSVNVSDKGINAFLSDEKSCNDDRDSILLNPDKDYKKRPCNGVVPGEDEIEDILDLSNYKNQVQNKQDGQYITSISIRPPCLPSINIEPNGPDSKQNKSIEDVHIKTEEQLNVKDAKQNEQTYGKQNAHTEAEEQWEKIERTLEHIDSKISRSAEWKALAVVVDRLSFYFFTVVGIIGMIVIFVLLH